MTDDLVVREWVHDDNGVVTLDRAEHNALARAHLDLLNRFDNASSLLEAAQTAVTRLQDQLAASAAARWRALEALEKYGDHDISCRLQRRESLDHGNMGRCECGYEEALAEPRKDEPKP